MDTIQSRKVNFDLVSPMGFDSMFPDGGSIDTVLHVLDMLSYALPKGSYCFPNIKGIALADQNVNYSFSPTVSIMLTAKDQLVKGGHMVAVQDIATKMAGLTFECTKNLALITPLITPIMTFDEQVPNRELLFVGNLRFG